jgi:hypothetical protein
MEAMMNTHLKLVSDNPVSVSSARLNGQALHQLADVLTEEVRAGHYDLARFLAAFHKLSPFAIAVIATWMTRAGLSEAEILNVVL